MFKVRRRSTRIEQFHLYYELLTYFTPSSSIFFVSFEHIIADWVSLLKELISHQDFGHLV